MVGAQRRPRRETRRARSPCPAWFESRRPTRKADFVVDVNHAEVAELVELPGVGQAIAERIVEYRKQNGPFKSVDDLREVTGIGPKTLEALRPHVRVK